MLRTIPLIAAAALAVFTLAGCNPTIDSPLSGKKVTAEQLVAEARESETEEAARLQADEDAAARAIREAARAARLRASDIRQTADLATADAQRALARLAIETDADIESANQDLDAARRRHEAAVAQLDQTVTAGLERIEQERQRRLGAFKFVTQLPVVSQALGSAGVGGDSLGMIASVLFGAAGAGWATNRRARKQIDEAFDEGRAQALSDAERQRQAEHAAWNEAQADMLKLATTARLPSNTA